MTTEDDTFRVLARPSYKKMEILYNQWMSSNKVDNNLGSINNVIFAKHYGWTWDEFMRARKENKIDDRR